MNKDDEIIPKKSKAEELLELVDSSIDNNNSIKIKSLELTNYRFFYDKDEKNNKFDFDGRNVLIYGENGSGKSSFYKALELLTKNKIEKGYFSKEKNIFSETNPSVNFTFTNDRGLTFDTDSEDPQTFELRKPDFINSLDIFKPMLDYKRLLGIHYSQVETDKINIYNMLKQTIRDFPVEYNSKETKLFDISSPTHRLEEIKNVLNTVLLNDINELITLFSNNDSEFKIIHFKTDIEDSESGTPEYTVNLFVDYKDNPIDSYHSFLNEAKLSALAISIYFACIKKLFGSINNNSIKILVLDDLLISLDMSNRLKLIKILKEKFSDFQIFFFTHDKDLFELYKDKLDWKSFELYSDNSDQIPKCTKKETISLIEKANKFFDEKEYDLCGVLLRKDLERILNKYLKPKTSEKLYNLVERAKEITPNNEKIILEKILAHTKHILNPSSHNDNRNKYSEELKEAINDLEHIRILENIELKKTLDKYTQISIKLTKNNEEIIYYGSLSKDLFYSNKYNLMDCICKITSKRGDNNHSLKSTKYISLFELYKKICETESIKEEIDYYNFIQFKDKENNWISLSDILS